MTITDRPKGNTAAKICAGMGLQFHLGLLGRGTASSEVLDVLGLGETDKAVILTLAVFVSALIFLHGSLSSFRFFHWPGQAGRRPPADPRQGQGEQDPLPRVPLEGEQGGVVFSLPVDSIEGLSMD